MPPTILLSSAGSDRIRLSKVLNIAALLPNKEAENSDPASRESGAGDKMVLIRESEASSAVPMPLVPFPMRERTKLRMACMNRCSAVIASPLGLIAASFCWNSGLLKASATNSSKDCAPYAVSSESLTLL